MKHTDLIHFDVSNFDKSRAEVLTQYIEGQSARRAGASKVGRVVIVCIFRIVSIVSIVNIYSIFKMMLCIFFHMLCIRNMHWMLMYKCILTSACAAYCVYSQELHL